MTTESVRYFVGDIHGKSNLLEILLDGIEKDAATRGVAPRVSFLGDITDRGLTSMEAMEMVHDTLEKWQGSVLHLGNHDQWFLDAIDTNGTSEEFGSWFLCGGEKTIRSYCDGRLVETAMEIIRDDFPHHVKMLREAKMLTRFGPFVAVHAGIDPTIPLDSQTENDMLWIRDPFLHYVDHEMQPVIHGHTIQGERPVVTENRISIDTGAFHTGRLTCCVIDAVKQEMSFFQAVDDRIEPVEPILVDRGHGTVLDRLPLLFYQFGREKTACHA